MPGRLAALILAGFALAGSGAAGGMAMKNPPSKGSTGLPRARDGNIAIREELEAARRAGTLAAYDLFLARHGEHPLAAAARRERARIAARAQRSLP